ncbi:hypothetical protein GYMLUDRAFT_179316, partial [Collybiopsis luxurians FD-317 M1]
LFKFNTIEVSPDLPPGGQPLSVRMTGKVIKPTEVDLLHSIEKRMGLTAHLLSFSVHTLFHSGNDKASIRCPVEKGDFDLEYIVDLPKEIPKAKFYVNVKGYSVNDDETICLNL